MSDIDTKTIEALAAEIKSSHAKAVDDVKEIAEKALGMAEKGEKATASFKEKADEALVKMNELAPKMEEMAERVAVIEQKAAKPKGNGDVPQSLGNQFVTNERVKAFMESGASSGKVDMRVKATITSATTDAAGSAGDLVLTTRLPGVVELPQRTLFVRDLISPGRMGGNALEYVKETGFTNSAAPTAENTAKPQSDLKFDLVSTTAKVIAHWMKASRQILDDAPMLASTIDQRLNYGLKLVEEAQLLNGDGTGQNLLGIVPQATNYAAPSGIAADSIIDTLRIAMLQAVLAEFPATGHVLNPIDWAAFELLKDDMGRYIIGNPQGGTAPTLWRLPVVETQAMAQGKFLTGAFKVGAQVFDRWDARVEVGYVNDDFTKNLVTILGEERLALAVYRPESFVYGNIAVPTP